MSKVCRPETVDYRQLNDSTFKFYDTGNFSLYNHFRSRRLCCVFGGQEPANKGQGQFGM
jgi:hypothetical protein